MAIELVTGHAGSAHVSSEDVGLYQSLTAGSGRYVLGDAPTLTMTDANTLSISACSLLVDGRYVRLTGTNTLAIQSGAQTGQRIDIVYVRYAQASDGTESAALGVKTGETATTATAPTLDYTGSILDGDQNVDIEVARVTLDALTPTATWTLPVLESLSGLAGAINGGSIAPASTETGTLQVGGGSTAARIYFGTKIIRGNGSMWQVLFTPEEFARAFGRAFDNSKDFFCVMNGDQAAFNTSFYSAIWHGTNGMVVTYSMNASTSQVLRVNYLAILGA
ncbi:MAG: hypothetical protein SOV20_08855 [Coriobacteriales bacterium]|nr:hypothetical protein [Coriobacteriales bacterium]